ncbi:alpha/beta hydrolase family protein [Fimbriiglobus ruber]|nr:acetylxylan esterase [Fimbriiglobus ruber]
MRRILPVLLGAAALIASPPAAPAVDRDQLVPAKLPSHSEWPDPLVTFDGQKVTTKEDWATKRRPELKMLFEELMYGRYPTVKTNVTGKVVHEDKEAYGGKATLREVAVSVGVPGAPPFYLLLVTPNKHTGPVPLFVGLNFSGNHTLTADPKVRIPDGWIYPNSPGVKDGKATEADRGKVLDVWPFETIVDHGYAVATVYSGDIIPDNQNVRGGLADVVMPVAAGKKAPWETATVMAWAWGVHRAVDYLQTLPEIDAKRIATVGHSRLGKAAIVTAAFDDRIALAIPHQAGCGGTAPDRRKNPKSEPLDRINKTFPHWFCDNFKAFNDDATKLPFDQHCLVAICAPRPVLFTNATDDQWADPPGQFEVLKAATPVYKLLGVDGVVEGAAPVEGKLTDSRLGYWIRPGKHSMNRDDWAVFIQYADKWLK